MGWGQRPFKPSIDTSTTKVVDYYRHWSGLVASVGVPSFILTRHANVVAGLVPHLCILQPTIN
jgi:hypothetical protein